MCTCLASISAVRELAIHRIATAASASEYRQKPGFARRTLSITLAKGGKIHPTQVLVRNTSADDALEAPPVNATMAPGQPASKVRAVGSACQPGSFELALVYLRNGQHSEAPQSQDSVALAMLYQVPPHLRPRN